MNGTPFFFDQNIFEPDESGYEVEREKPDEPKHTDQVLEQVRADSFAKGKAEGLKEAENSLSKEVLTIVQKIEREIAVLTTSEKGRNTRFENEAVHLTTCILSKLFPTLQKQLHDDELKRTIEESLSQYATPHQITIEIPHTSGDALIEQIQNISQTIDKNAKIIKSDELPQGEARISWPEGGIIANHGAIADKTFEILHETLAERGISVHDNQEDISDDELSVAQHPEDNKESDQ